MPLRRTARPADPESAAELRNRALIIRRHSADFANDPAVPKWLELAAELETRAAALEAAENPVRE
jgi:hypothetical protein